MKQEVNFIIRSVLIIRWGFLHSSLVLFLIAISFKGFTQNLNIKFDRLGYKSGLSNGNVNSIIQDSRGFIWFGTADGLNKFDSYVFTVYKNNPADSNSLNNNSIKSIIEDSKKVIWIGTWGGGLNKFDREKNKFIHFKHSLTDANSISSDFVTCLWEDKQGNLWIGTGDGGLDMFDRKKGKFIHYIYPNDNRGLGNNYVTGIFGDSQDNLWIGTISRGLHVIDKNNKTFRSFQHNSEDDHSLCDNDVNTIFEDKGKNLWIGTNKGGLDMMNRSTGKFIHFKNKILSGSAFTEYAVLSITEDNDGIFWIGTRDGGLNIFNPQTGVSQNYHYDELDITSLSGNTVPVTYKDTKGNMWMGTFAGGINFVNIAGNDFIHYEHNSSIHSLSNNNVTAICEDADENLWIGTNGSGLNLLNRESGRFIHYRHQVNNKNSIGSDNVLSICEDSKGNLWIGTWAGGITVFNKKKNTFRHFKNDPANSSSLGSDNVWTIFEDRDKNIWIGTYGKGLDLYNRDNDSFTHYEYDEKKPGTINNNQVITIFEDSKGFLWIGTDGGGLNKFDKGTKKFSHFIHDDSRNSLSYNFVGDIIEDKSGNLYIATGVGLNYFNTNTHHFTVYAASNGFTNYAASGIIQDDKGNLWISTTEGISYFNSSTKKFINFSTEDGLHFNKYNGHAYFKSRSGMVYFGGINGVDGFFPNGIAKVSFDPPLLITDFQVFNKKVPIAINENDASPLKKDIAETEKIIIPYSSSVISFEFASLHYGVQERKQYAYKLEGFDKTWNEAGMKRLATYTNLDPRKYIFKVKGLNNNGEWSSNTISIQLIVAPPFWLTWWFKMLAVLTVVGGALGFYRYRISAINQQKIKLQIQVNEQTRELLKSTKEEHKARREAEQSNIGLERKNKELEQFAYVASHDLQEPLTTTSSFAGLMQERYHGKLDERADKYLNYIVDSSDRMKILIKDLLDFSRIGFKAQLEELDCNKVLKDVVTGFATAINNSGIEIKCDSLPVIYAYPIEIRQLFQNLLSNAIKFRDRNTSPVINISAQKIADHWQFAFADNGIGIDKQHNEKIFIIFQRLHNRSVYKGSGIGLSHCKKIVELHHGKIWVKSAPGKGSTFYFTLPVEQGNIRDNIPEYQSKLL